MSEEKNGYLERPIFGVRPELPMHLNREQKVYEFEPILNMVRERPMEWAKIAEYKGSNRKQTLNQQRAARARLWRWLLLNYPLEDWKVSTRMTPDTWGDRELWVSYRGTLTPEEALKLVQQRQEAYSNKIQRSGDLKADRQARQRMRAMLAERENRRRSADVE